MIKLADELRKMMKEMTNWGNEPKGPVLLPPSLYDRAAKTGMDMSDYAKQEPIPCSHQWEVLPDEWETKRCIHCGEEH